MTPYIHPINKQLLLKIKLLKNKHRGGSSHDRTTRLNNRTEITLYKQKSWRFLPHMYDTNDEMVNYEILLQ